MEGRASLKIRSRAGMKVGPGGEAVSPHHQQGVDHFDLESNWNGKTEEICERR